MWVLPMQMKLQLHWCVALLNYGQPVSPADPSPKSQVANQHWQTRQMLAQRPPHPIRSEASGMQFNLMGFLGKESFSWSEPAGGLMAMFVRARTKQILGPQLLSFASSFSAFKWNCFLTVRMICAVMMVSTLWQGTMGTIVRQRVPNRGGHCCTKYL